MIGRHFKDQENLPESSCASLLLPILNTCTQLHVANVD